MDIYNTETLEYIANENNITFEQSKDLMNRSNNIMPIMLIQYGNDIETIFLKMKEYQNLILEDFKNNKQ